MTIVLTVTMVVVGFLAVNVILFERATRRRFGEPKPKKRLGAKQKKRLLMKRGLRAGVIDAMDGRRDRSIECVLMNEWTDARKALSSAKSPLAGRLRLFCSFPRTPRASSRVVKPRGGVARGSTVFISITFVFVVFVVFVVAFGESVASSATIAAGRRRDTRRREVDARRRPPSSSRARR